MGDDAWTYAALRRETKMSNRVGSQLFATSWLGLGKAETPITADKREIKDFPKPSPNLLGLGRGAKLVLDFFYPKTLYAITASERLKIKLCWRIIWLDTKKQQKKIG